MLDLSLEHRSLPATFAFDQREQGVQEWKKDRTLTSNLLADGLAFKIQR